MQYLGTEVPGHDITHEEASGGMVLRCSCGQWETSVDYSAPGMFTRLQELADRGLEHLLRALGEWPEPVRDERDYFGGFSPRRCGEHRTVGTYRAWCYDDGQWCYPGDGCAGCRVERS